MKYLFASIVIVVCLWMSESHAQYQRSAQPPIPNAIIEHIDNLHHPFLLLDRKAFRDVRRALKDPLFKDRGGEFFYRAVGYADKTSFWYIGEGPFSEDSPFDPMQIKEEDFNAYLKVVIDTCVYIGIEQDRVDINRAMKEFLRVLDAVEQGQESPSFSVRRAKLFAAASILFDMVYMRFDTVERHEPVRRFKAIRDRLASFCRTKNLEELNPADSAVYGSALGLSSLFCISVYDDEWKRSNTFSVHSLLPDLYLAANWTKKGLANLVSENMRFDVSNVEIDSALLAVVPWVECMKRLGYPYMTGTDTFARMAAALEAHRVPGAVSMVQPYQAQRTTNPWLPFKVPLFSNDPLMEQLVSSATKTVEEEVDETALAVEKQVDTNKNVSPLSKAVDDFRNQNINLQEEPRSMTLREQLEKFMQPQPKRSYPKIEEPIQPDALEDRWEMPNREYMQTLWGTVYMLAALEAPRSRFKSIWSDYAVEMDSHPYSFLYWKPFPRSRMDESPQTQFVRYPESGFTLMAENTTYGDYLLASQASSETIMRGTYIAQSESFFMSDNTTEWRWYHEIPLAATQILSASEIKHTTETEAYLNLVHERIHAATPQKKDPALLLQTSMYSCWSTESPAGKTIQVRRHWGGLGSPYNITAHFPDPNTDRHLQYINFKMEPGSDTGIDPTVPGKLIIRPIEAIENTEPYSLDEWRHLQSAKRFGNDMLSIFGILNIIYSPESLKRAALSEGVVGRFLETELENTKEPFFYITIVEQPGREMLDVKYGSLPLPGLRFIEWKSGLEILSINTGNGIDNTFIKSDADFVLVSRDQSYGGVFYLMVNGTELQVRYSPKQNTWTTLANAAGDPVTVAFTKRKLYAANHLTEGSAFYAPDILGMESPDGRVRFGKKNRQAVVLRN